MPATTTSTEAASSSARLLSSRWIPATPTSYSRSTRLPASRAVKSASSATGRSLVPAATTRICPRPLSTIGRLLDDQRARLPLVARVGHQPQHLVDGGIGDARRQHVGAGRGQLGHDATDLRRRLAQAEDHLGKAGAQVAMVVDAREAEIFVRQVGQLVQRRVDGGVALLNALEKRA